MDATAVLPCPLPRRDGVTAGHGRGPALRGLSVNQVVLPRPCCPQALLSPGPGTAIQTASLPYSTAGKGGCRFSCSALGSANSVTPPLGTRTSLQKRVKPDLREAGDTPPRSHPARACRTSSSTPQREPGQGSYCRQDSFLLERSGLQVSHSSFQISKTGRFTLPTAKPISLAPRRQTQETAIIFTLTRQNGKRAASSQIRTHCLGVDCPPEHPQGSVLPACPVPRMARTQTPLLGGDHRSPGCWPCCHHSTATCTHSHREGTTGVHPPRSDDSSRIRQQLGFHL